LTITDSSDEDLLYSGSYEIESFTSSAGNLSTVTVFGLFVADSTSLTLGKITKNTRTSTNPVGLYTAVREEADLTASRSVQVCNPDAVKVISSGIRPSEITTSNRFIGVSIDFDSAVILDLYNGDVPRQSIDSMVSKFNEQCAENAYSFLSYRVDFEEGNSEFAIAYNLPNSNDDEHTITISRGSDGGIDAAGFSSVEDIAIFSEYGSKYYINGEPEQGLNVKLDSTTLSFSPGSVIVNSSASGLDFLSLDLKKGDLLTITDAPDSSDNGSYLIRGISGDQLILDSGQLPSGFTSSNDDLTRFRIYSDTASFDSVVFDEINGTFGAILVDIFLNEDRKVFIDKRFEYESSLLVQSSLLTLVDYEGEVGGKQFSLNISGGTNLATISLDDGPTEEIRGNNTYVWITSGSENTRLKFHIPNVDDVITAFYYR